jgi:hypothetical protein
MPTIVKENWTSIYHLNGRPQSGQTRPLARVRKAPAMAMGSTRPEHRSEQTDITNDLFTYAERNRPHASQTARAFQQTRLF